MNTKEGGRNHVKSMTEKFGSYEAFCEWMRANASIGGRKGRTGGFASEKIGADGLTGRQRARVAGAAGGTRSRRHKDA